MPAGRRRWPPIREHKAIFDAMSEIKSAGGGDHHQSSAPNAVSADVDLEVIRRSFAPPCRTIAFILSLILSSICAARRPSAGDSLVDFDLPDPRLPPITDLPR
jgi:hypothetical protein